VKKIWLFIILIVLIISISSSGCITDKTEVREVQARVMAITNHSSFGDNTGVIIWSSSVRASPADDTYSKEAWLFTPVNAIQKENLEGKIIKLHYQIIDPSQGESHLPLVKILSIDIIN
jgi:hypothetical protein